jgi:hypothetical protein
LFFISGFAISDGNHPGVSVETDFVDYHPPPVEVDNYIDIEVTHVENLDQFWCHLMTSNEEMEHLMSNLQDYYDANPPKGTDLNQFSQGKIIVQWSWNVINAIKIFKLFNSSS